MSQAKQDLCHTTSQLNHETSDYSFAKKQQKQDELLKGNSLSKRRVIKTFNLIIAVSIVVE